jgi:hypothetical protein
MQVLVEFYSCVSNGFWKGKQEPNGMNSTVFLWHKVWSVVYNILLCGYIHMTVLECFNNMRNKPISKFKDKKYHSANNEAFKTLPNF